MEKSVTSPKSKYLFSYIKTVKNKKSLIQAIEANKAYINETDEKGRTILILMCMNKEPKKDVISKIGVLLSFAECDLNIKERSGYSALTYACLLSNNTVIEMLLKTGKCDVDSHCTLNRMPLMACCLMRNNIGVKMLLETGKCDINARDGYGYTALFYACGELEIDIVEMLLHTGKCDVNIKSNAGYTALKKVCNSFMNPKEVELFRLLLSCEDLILDVEDGFRNEILYTLINHHDENSFQKTLLFINDDRCNLNHRDWHGNTVLTDTVNTFHKNKRVIKALLSSERCDINAKNLNKQTPLHILYKNLNDERDLEILDLFLKHPKCDQNIKDVWGFRPIEYVNTSMKKKISEPRPKVMRNVNKDSYVLEFEIVGDKVFSSLKEEEGEGEIPEKKVAVSSMKSSKKMNRNKGEFNHFEKKILKASITKNDYEHKEFDSSKTKEQPISIGIDVKEFEDLKTQNQTYIKNLKEIEAIQKNLNDRMSLLEEQNKINLNLMKEQQTIIENLKSLNVEEFTRDCSKPSDFEMIQEKAKNFHSKLIQSTLYSYKNAMKTNQAQMQQQLDEFYNETLCVICIEEKKSCLIQPCNHACICLKCSKDLKQCPICRSKISSKIQFF